MRVGLDGPRKNVTGCRVAAKRTPLPINCSNKIWINKLINVHLVRSQVTCIAAPALLRLLLSYGSSYPIRQHYGKTFIHCRPEAPGYRILVCEFYELNIDVHIYAYTLWIWVAQPHSSAGTRNQTTRGRSPSLTKLHAGAASAFNVYKD